MRTKSTNASGVATFDDLSINNSGLGYTLVATTGSASTTSNGFDIANDVNPCSGTCSATGSTATTSATTTASGLGSGALSSRLGPAAAAAPGDARLGMTVNPSVTVPASVCGTGSNSAATDSASVPSGRLGTSPRSRWSRRWTRQWSRRAGRPMSRCGTSASAPSTSPPVRRKPGLYELLERDDLEVVADEETEPCAVARRRLLLGARRRLPEQVKNCPTAPGSNRFPGVLSKHKTNAGDVVITFCVPYPWDEKGGFG